MPRTTPLALASAALLAAACSTMRGRHAEFQPVSDADYGRLQPEQLGPVDQARSALAASRDELARTRLRLEQAGNEIGLARSDQTAARAVEERAQAQRAAAEGSNEPNATAAARETAARAELRSRAAKAHMAYAQRLVEARQREVDAAERLVKLREEELERAKLTALTQAGIPAAAKYNPGTFDARVARALEEYSQRRADAAQASRAALEVENAWRALHAQYQARIEGQGPSATGTGVAPPPVQPPPPSPPQQRQPGAAQPSEQ